MSSKRIVWNDDGKTGRMITQYENRGTSTTTIYKREYGIYQACISAALALINNPEELQKDEPICTLHRPSFTLMCIYPELPLYEVRELVEKIKPLGKIIKEYIGDKSGTDIEFLLELGKHRNWKKECAICLTEDIMGTTCKCGHTEITIFRPCGHSVCTQPCFKGMMKESNQPIIPRTFSSGGQVFEMVGSVDVQNVSGMTCHMCRQEIESAFQAQDCRFNSEGLKEICKQFASAL